MESMVSLFQLLVALISVFVTVACTTPSKPQEVIPDATQVSDKAGSKHQDVVTPGAQVAPGTNVTNPPQIWQFYQAHIFPGTKLSEGDRDLLGKMGQAPDANSVTEAALIIGISKAILQLRPTPTFEESDLFPKESEGAQVNSTRTTPSLENALLQKQVNVVRAISNNPFLQGFGVQQMILDTLRISTDTPQFIEQIAGAIRQNASSWAALSQNATTVVSTERVNPVATDIQASERPKKISAADLRSGDAALVEAQALADRGLYQEAILKVQQIPQGNPLYLEAQDKIKTFSNNAVQDLRKKAAQAFQSSLPVNEAKAKANYLQQAKAYLEEALKKYPQADQLAIVRENLAVISSDLKNLESE